MHSNIEARSYAAPSGKFFSAVAFGEQVLIFPGQEHDSPLAAEGAAQQFLDPVLETLGEAFAMWREAP